MDNLTQKQWKEVTEEQKKAYQEDLSKYTKQITALKKSNFEQRKTITKLTKKIDCLYPFIQSTKNKIEEIENKFKLTQ